VIFIIDNFHSDLKLFSIKTKIPRVFSSLENNAINSIVVKDDKIILRFNANGTEGLNVVKDVVVRHVCVVVLLMEVVRSVDLK
jgi:hypothetical protein